MDAATKDYIDAQFRELKSLIVQARPTTSDTITADTIRQELGLKSRFGLCKWTARYNLKPIARGIYRAEDFRAAKARAALSQGGNMVRRKPRTVSKA